MRRESSEFHFAAKVLATRRFGVLGLLLEYGVFHKVASSRPLGAIKTVHAQYRCCTLGGGSND
jgi:hypothetical protein